MNSGGSSANPSAAEDAVALVEDGCLAGRDGGLRLGEGDVHAVVFERRGDGGRRVVLVADLDPRLDRLADVDLR
jgi:hypothetical protein